MCDRRTAIHSKGDNIMNRKRRKRHGSSSRASFSEVAGIFYRVSYKGTDLFEIRSFLYPHAENPVIQEIMRQQGLSNMDISGTLKRFKKRWRGILTNKNACADKNGHRGAGMYATGCNAFFTLADAKRYAFVENIAGTPTFLKFEGIQISKHWMEEQEAEPMRACIVKPTKLIEIIRDP